MMNTIDIAKVQIFKTEQGGICEVFDRPGYPCGSEAHYMRILEHKDGFSVSSKQCHKHAARDAAHVIEANDFDGIQDISGLAS